MDLQRATEMALLSLNRTSMASWFISPARAAKKAVLSAHEAGSFLHHRWTGDDQAPAT
jgi:hypothetical protein